MKLEGLYVVFENLALTLCYYDYFHAEESCLNIFCHSFNLPPKSTYVLIRSKYTDLSLQNSLRQKFYLL